MNEAARPPTALGPRRILIVCPAPPGSRVGNRVTALRWARLLRAQGHRVTIRSGYAGKPDLVIALHAVRSSEAVQEAHRAGRRIVVVLTGTDFQPRLGRAALATLARADRVVLLHRPPPGTLPPAVRRKAVVIVQSARAVARKRGSDGRFFVGVVGHLRPVKDPFRTARAARHLGARSRLEVVHAGQALTPEMRTEALREAQRNPRYRWVGDLPRARALQLIADLDLFVLSSRHEGGASALSEAVASGVPVLATRIPTAVFLLGGRYPGLFAPGATRALTRLLARAEQDAAFLTRLRRAVRARRPRVSETAEAHALWHLLARL